MSFKKKPNRNSLKKTKIKFQKNWKLVQIHKKCKDDKLQSKLTSKIRKRYTYEKIKHQIKRV